VKLVIVAATVVALIGITPSSAATGVRPGTMAAHAPAAVDKPILRRSQGLPTAQRFASGVTTSLPAAPADKPAALMPAPKPAAAPALSQAALDPSSPEAIGAAQLWRARGLGAIDTLKQVVEEMAKSVRQADIANVRNDCRLVGDIGDAISQSLPSPDQQVDTQFRRAAGTVKAGALKCQSWGKGLSKSQTDAFLTDMKSAVNDIKATKDLLAPK
jgi:hypothetical protein